MALPAQGFPPNPVSPAASMVQAGYAQRTAHDEEGFSARDGV